jgi:hypothetical protein
VLQPVVSAKSGQICREDETDKHKLLCQQLGMEFVSIIFTASGGMGEQFQRQYWNPHWSSLRVEAGDEAMHIGLWAARKRKATWQARFAVAIAKCNASLMLA